MSDHYLLIGQTPVPVEPCDPYTPEGIAGLIQWGREFETTDRRVAFTKVLGLCYVSTVFLGLDHSFARMMGGDGPPILFESMAFWAGDGFLPPALHWRIWSCGGVSCEASGRGAAAIQCSTWPSSAWINWRSVATSGTI